MTSCDKKISVDLAALAAEFKAFHKLMDEREKRYDERFLAQENARKIYAEGEAAWKAHANAFREQLAEERKHFATKGLTTIIGVLTMIALGAALADRLLK